MKLMQRKKLWVVYDDHDRVVIMSHSKHICLNYIKELGYESRSILQST